MLEHKPIVFDWVKDGENCGEPILKAQVFDYSLQVYKAHGTKLWSYRINSMGCANISSKDEAIFQAQQTLTDCIVHRLNKAKSDMYLFTYFAKMNAEVKNTLDVYWSMLRELESVANDKQDKLLQLKVQQAYELWERIKHMAE